MSNDIKISRELADELLDACSSMGWTVAEKLRALLAAPADERQPEGRRERFQKWVLATEHPVLGFLDGHWLERGDDREGYANEYVQGLWVAYKAFTSPPAPVSVMLPERLTRKPLDYSDERFFDGWNACLDKLKELNQ